MILSVILTLLAILAGYFAAKYSLRPEQAVAKNHNSTEWQLLPSCVQTASLSFAEQARSVFLLPFSMPRREALYFLAVRDHAGDPLRADCDYDIIGNSMSARWWSLSVYGDNMIRMSRDWVHSSLSVDTIIFEPDGRYQARLSRTAMGQNWLASPQTSLKTYLLLRLYHPAGVSNQVIERMELPIVVRRP